MGNRGKIKLEPDYGQKRPDDVRVWEKFSDYNYGRDHVTVSHEQKTGFKIAVTQLVMDHVKKNGAKGSKRKKALKEFRQSVEGDDSCILVAQAAVKLGIPRDTLTAVAMLFT